MNNFTIKWVVLLLLLPIIMIILPIGSAAISKELASFSGRVYDSTSNSGIGNLVVRLTPPRDSKLPQNVTTTNQDGQFSITGLKKGRYLIEVKQGPTLLFRDVIDTTRETNKDIMLRELN